MSLSNKASLDTHTPTSYNNFGVEVAQLVEQRTENPEARHELVSKFIDSRRQGLSPQTIRFYSGYLNRAIPEIGLNVFPHDIKTNFLNSLQCSNGGKHAYFRTLRVFCNWLYSKKSDFGLNPQNNLILIVDPPKVEKKILPSLTTKQLDYLINQAKCIRDKAVISLFADSGLRLSELANINPHGIDWEHRLIKVNRKGNKEGLAVFGERTKSLLKEWLSEYIPNGRLWDISNHSINIMLRRLMCRTGLPCNAHTFRRTFACILAKRGVDSLHINRLGRWESMRIVERYPASVRFEDSLEHYSAIVSN